MMVDRMFMGGLVMLAAGSHLSLGFVPRETPLVVPVASRVHLEKAGAMCTVRRPLKKTPIIRMSDDDDFDFGDDDDDALSKLIGKRDVIRSTKKEAPPPSEKPVSDEEITEPKDLDVGDLDLENLPEFKTKRPMRTPKKSKEDEKKDDAVDEDDTINYIDYMADYDDENEFHIPNRIGFGTAAWGNERKGFKVGKKLKKKDIKAGRYLAGDLQLSYDTLMESGIVFVDTSESYGRALEKKSLSSEHIVGRCVDENARVDPLVASTFANPWMHLLEGGGVRFGRRGVVNALEQTCERLGVSGVELYQVPAALYLGFPNALADGLSECLDKGLCNYVGVCNMGKLRMRSMAKKMERRGASLTSNQFKFSLTNRKAWKSGLIGACKDIGVIPIAHTPLDGGLATGVYSSTNPSGGKAGGKFPYELKTLNKWQPLTSMMQTVQSKVKTRLEREKRDEQSRYKRGAQPRDINTDVTTTQIAINYVVAKGCVPIPGVKTVAQAEEVLGCLGWGLNDEEVQLLDSAADASEKGIKL
eukprot:CAMPEP_0197460708 /NCGR_PEP_ID=MMETSP1175-20131217/54754_1 /TAXON_ID=1003142 /ORGANISM="Triceratium dubium, Strain CCMP147" /LENGTH=528 /DNA_ID=CAMNT_0042995857 /DNA_START=201 /DNA_END=1787 /DNA_ORIENTATION=-